MNRWVAPTPSRAVVNDIAHWRCQPRLADPPPAKKGPGSR